MSLKYLILCLLAFIIAIVLGIKNYEAWNLPPEVSIEKVGAKKPGTRVESPAPATGTAGQKEPSPVESYVLIAGKNIFSPERKDFPVFIDPSKAEGKKPAVRPQVILYGVTIVGDYTSASVANPGRPLQKGEREIMTLKPGDRIGEYKLSKILADRITLEAQGDSFEVFLYDPKAPKKRVFARTETKPATITSTLPGPTPPPGTAPPPGTPQPPPVGVARPGEPIKGGIAEGTMPRSITPTPVPSPRTRRWYGPTTPAPGGPAVPTEPEPQN